MIKIKLIFVISLKLIISVNTEAVYKTFPLSNTALIRVFPCDGTETISEWFDWRNQTRDINEYRLNIDLKKYEFGPTLFTGSNITIKFNKDTNTTVKDLDNLLSLGEHEYILRINKTQSDKIDIIVREDPGIYLPDVLSMKIDGNEQCSENVELGVWDDYIIGGDEKPITTTPKSVDNSDKINCGRKQIFHTELITNGLKTKPGDWPWHAALYKTQSSISTQSYICGGTLLNPSTVLTAGHCVTENGAKINSNRLFVVLGKYNLAGGDVETQEKSVYDILVHAEFNYSNLKNDIALVKMASDVKYTQYVQPICLWKSEKAAKSYIYGKNGSVAGWGFTENNAVSQQLLQTTMPVVDELTCLRSYTRFFERYLTERTFCAGSRQGSSVCNGDSGGGLYFPETIGKIERWFIRGITSISVSKVNERLCDPNHYVIFTDVANYLDWIANNL